MKAKTPAAFSLAFLGLSEAAVALLRQRRLRTRAALTTALLAWARVVRSLLGRRMLEVGTLPRLLALAAVAAVRRRQGLAPLRDRCYLIADLGGR